MAIKRSQNEERNAATYHDCRICTLLCVILRILPVRAPHGGLGKFGWCNTRQAFRAAKDLALGSQSSALLCAIPPGPPPTAPSNPAPNWHPDTLYQGVTNGSGRVLPARIHYRRLFAVVAE
jgi:hypothetical protein